VESNETVADGTGPEAAGEPVGLAPVETLWAKIRVSEDWTDAERENVLDDLFPDGDKRLPYLERFVVLIVLSTTIAAFGLIASSAAVVIGAMLVAPLMTPILALAASLTHLQTRRFMGSLLVVAAGTGMAIAVGWLVSAVASGTLTEDHLSSELLARTTPNLLDLGIAVAAGLAAGYVLTHKGAGSSLPGVAIAVALVPPLATVGITLELGAQEKAVGALLLYGTNLIAIVLSASIVMVVTGFVPDRIRKLGRGRISINLLPWAIALLLVALPLGLHTRQVIADEQFVRAVTDAVADWDPRAEIVELNADRTSTGARVELIVATTSDREPAWRLAESISIDQEMVVELDVRYREESADAASAG
jgi:uncharacterized hydrophobic protein (TIGR00271 family)